MNNLGRFRLSHISNLLFLMFCRRLRSFNLRFYIYCCENWSRVFLFKIVLCSFDFHHLKNVCMNLFLAFFAVFKAILCSYSHDVWHQAESRCSSARHIREKCSSNTRRLTSKYRLLESWDSGTDCQVLYWVKLSLKKSKVNVRNEKKWNVNGPSLLRSRF